MSALRRELLVEKHRNAHLEAELVKLKKSAVEIVSFPSRLKDTDEGGGRPPPLPHRGQT